MKRFWKVTGMVVAALFLIASAGIGVLYARVTGWDNRAKVDCPILAYLHPVARAPISASDYLEVLSISGWGSEPIRIRIYGDGQVERDTTFVMFNREILGCPLHDADKHVQVQQKEAVALLTRARDGGFCRLCTRYRFPGTIYDAGSETLTFSLGGTTKSVWDHAGTPPPLFNELIETSLRLSPIDDLADTMKFTPERKQECIAFWQQQEVLHPRPK